jgi:hypothetical protein
MLRASNQTGGGMPSPKRSGPGKQRVTRRPTKAAGRDARGRTLPHDPNEETRKQVEKLAKRGADSDEIAVILNLRPGQVRAHYGDLVDRCMAEHSLDVEEAVKAAAVGYSHPDVHIGTWDGEAIITNVTKHYPPNISAAQFWLRNRRPRAWRVDVEGGARDPDEAARMVRERLRQLDQATGDSKNSTQKGE